MCVAAEISAPSIELRSSPDCYTLLASLFQTAVASDYDADSAVERELVLRIASVLWRLRRSTLIDIAGSFTR